MTHTPGPWKVADRFYILMADDVACEVAKVCDGNIDDDMLGQCDADARLIASAPELLAALKRRAERREAFDDDEWQDVLRLIAKAEGRSE